MSRIVLASASPRRREICELIGLDFEVYPASAEPEIDLLLSPCDAVAAVADAKAKSIFEVFPKKTVIGADTSVYACGEFLGKPKDKADAMRMIKLLSGRVHEVITGVSIYSPLGHTVFADTSKVEFYPMTDEEILAYVSCNEPYDKAGGYAVQGLCAKYIKRIDGDFYTVMGLPCSRLYHELKNLGEM